MLDGIHDEVAKRLRDSFWIALHERVTDDRERDGAVRMTLAQLIDDMRPYLLDVRTVGRDWKGVSS
jgi:hypothetical protein